MIRMVAALCAGSAGFAAVAPASAQSIDCNWYADISLRQQQRNEHGKCGFTGPEWSPSRRVHLAWCATQTPDRWRAEAQKREQVLLSGCRR